MNAHLFLQVKEISVRSNVCVRVAGIALYQSDIEILEKSREWLNEKD